MFVCSFNIYTNLFILLIQTEGEDLTFTPPAEGHNFRNYALRFSIYKPDDDATDEEDEDDDVSDCDVSVGSSGTFVTPPNNTVKIYVTVKRCMFSREK